MLAISPGLAASTSSFDGADGTSPDARTIKLIVEYDGTGLCGWQRQENGPSVQQHLEEAIFSMVHAPVRVFGASRTDAGVHARAQVAHFATTSAIPVRGFRRGLNSVLPPGIAVIECHEARLDFHARFCARGKHYRYLIINRPERSPLYVHRAWHRPVALDVAAMTQAAQAMLGERDFSAFRAAGCSAKTTRRHVQSVHLSRPEPHIIQIDVRGNAFLRHMVRIMTGTLVGVGEGRLRAADIPAILASADRTQAGQTAPPWGLCLMKVFYPPAHPLE